MHAMLSLVPWYHWAWILPLLAGGGYLGFLFRLPLGIAAKAVPTMAWEILGALLVLGLFSWWLYAQGDAHGAAAQKDADATLIKAANEGRDTALAANATNQATIAALKASQATCEAGRIADLAAQAKAMAERSKTAAVAQEAYLKAKADLATLQAGRCKGWAEQAACGVTR